MPRYAFLTMILAIQLGACGGSVKSGTPDGDTDAVEDGTADMATDPGDDPDPDAAADPAGDPVHDGGPDASPDSGPMHGELGDPCANAGDCTELPGESRFCATEIPGPMGAIHFPGGYCSMGCNSPEACGEGGHCLMSPDGGEGMCMKLCDDDSDCRTSEGYSCTSIPSPSPPPDMCWPPMW